MFPIDIAILTIALILAGLIGVMTTAALSRRTENADTGTGAGADRPKTRSATSRAVSVSLGGLAACPGLLLLWNTPFPETAATWYAVGGMAAAGLAGMAVTKGAGHETPHDSLRGDEHRVRDEQRRMERIRDCGTETRGSGPPRAAAEASRDDRSR